MTTADLLAESARKITNFPPKKHHFLLLIIEK